MSYLIYGNVLIAAVLGLGALRRMPLFSPMMLSGTIWQVVFVCGLVFQHLFYPLTDGAFAMWVTWFLVSSAVYYVLYRPVAVTGPPAVRCQPIDYTVFLVVMILWLGYRIWVVGATGPEHFFLNLRLSSNALEGYEPLGLVARFYPLVFALFLFEHLNARSENRRLRVLLWIWMLLYAIATMGKFAVLTPVLGWSVIKAARSELSPSVLFLIVPLAVGVMLLLHFIRAGEGDQGSLAQLLSVYIYSPLVALGYMDSGPGEKPGAYVFRFIYALSYTIFGQEAPEAVILDYVEIPYPTNVYTAMQPFVFDFGVAGLVVGALLFGGVFGGLFRCMRNGFQLPIIAYAGLVVALVAQFIGDVLLTTLSGNLQFVICATIIVLISRRAGLGR